MISEKHAKLLDAVNNAKTKDEHYTREVYLRGWQQGMMDAGRYIDYCDCDRYYMEQGIDRPMCCGLFLDWEPEEVV